VIQLSPLLYDYRSIQSAIQFWDFFHTRPALLKHQKRCQLQLDSQHAFPRSALRFCLQANPAVATAYSQSAPEAGAELLLLINKSTFVL
jgi:hypothetical protein